jgi:predicted alpha/beta superfamily hydrolase
MKWFAGLVAAACFALSACSPPRAAEASVAREASAALPAPLLYEMPDSAVHTITSDALGRAYNIFVRLPPEYSAEANGSRRYPVVYINDAHYTFQTAAGVTLSPMRHGGLEHAILVGISYAQGEGGAASRGRDLTPTPNPGQKKFPTGGARDYLAFIKDEVIPFVEQAYRADPMRRTLTGQSYGGLFGAYALFNEPGLFSDYILTSPSLWYGNSVMFDMEAEFAKSHRRLPARVYFAIGETETPARNAGQYDMVGDQKRFADQLRSHNYEGLIVRDEVVEGGTHLTTFPIGLLRGLMWMLPGPTPYGG